MSAEELDDLRKRVADLELKYDTLLAILTAPPAGPDTSNGAGTFRWVERGGRKFEVREKEDPEEIYRSWMSLDPPPGPESA